MFDYLRAGCEEARCPRLLNKFRDAYHIDGFMNKVQYLKESLGLTPAAQQESNIQMLLSWRGCANGKSLDVAFSDFLDRYSRVNEDNLRGHEVSIIDNLRQFLAQSERVQHIHYLRDVTFCDMKGTVIVSELGRSWTSRCSPLKVMKGTDQPLVAGWTGIELLNELLIVSK